MRLAVAVGAVGVLSLLGSCAKPGSPVGLQATEVVVYAPWNADQDPDPTGSGSCYSASHHSARADAWRCIDSGSLLADPCFSDPFLNAAMVVCPGGDDGPVVMELTEELPMDLANAGDDAGEASPWELVLEDGSRCFPLGGATVVVGDMRLNFACTGGLELYGDIDRSAPVWTIVALSEGQSEGHRVRIAVART